MVNRKVRKALKGLKMLLKPRTTTLVETYLCGIPLKTVQGTVRSKPDKDDAWYFYLSGKYSKVYDIGANVGYTALLTTIQNKKTKILLVDPNPEALYIAAKNLILNNLAQRTSFSNYFIGDQSGKHIKFYSIGADAAGSMFSGHAESASAINQYYMVPTITIDDLAMKTGWAPELIKLDVEGAESLALQGATETAKKESPAFFVEMHSSKDLPIMENTKAVLQWCVSVNYNAWYLKEKRVLKSPEETKGFGKYHLLLLPQKSDFPEILYKIEERSLLPDSIE